MRFLPTLRTTAVRPPGDELEQKVVLGEYYAALASNYAANSLTRTWHVERAIREGYERIVWTFRAVVTIANSHAALDVVVREGTHTVEDHPLATLLNDGHANPLESGRQFRHRLSSQVSLSRPGAFVEITKSNAGTPKRLDLLPPGRTRIVPGRGSDLVDHFEVIPLSGGRRRPIPVERVRWIRLPHPTDPYSGMTPLEAAGLSVELDHFARLYNVAFLRNDARPGGILGIDGQMRTSEMERIEERFGHGPVEAGKLTVVNGKLTYADLAARPRDMAYETLSRNAKTEILVAFGVPESQLGNAADRTFANAAEERNMYWVVTMQPHNAIMTSGFADIIGDGLTLDLDVSGIDVLQQQHRAELEVARAEVDAGLRSIWSYAQLAGVDGVEDTPLTRALWIPAGKTPIPSRQADAGHLAFTASGQQPAGQGLRAGEAVAGVSPAEAPPDRVLPAGGPPPAARTTTARTSPPAGPSEPAPHETPDAGTPGEQKTTRRPALRLVQTKASPPTDPTGEQTATSEPDEADHDRLELALAAALAALTVKLLAVAAARLRSPKIRKGTRHWTADPSLPADTRSGTGPLDVTRIVDADGWSNQAQATAGPLLTPAAEQAAGAVLADLTGHDDEQGHAATAGAVAAVLAVIGASAAVQAADVAALIATLDQAGTPLTGIIQQVQARAGAMSSWADRLATQAATGVLEAARDAAVRAAGLAGVSRTWIARRDDKVRLTHRAANGQTQPLGTPFAVGDAQLRYPGDPAGPIGEVANCRCRTRLTYRRPHFQRNPTVEVS